MKFKKQIHWNRTSYTIGDYKILTDFSGGLCETIYDIIVINRRNNFRIYYSFQWSLGCARKRLYKIIKELRNI